MCIGVQGTPRKLGVPGQDLPHVSYTLRDPDAFQDKDVLVVGAGDAAIENALALAENNRVSLLNRSSEFARAKDANAALITKAINSGKITCYYDSSTARVEEDFVYIETPDGEVKLRCQQIIARIGAILPRKFLEGCGIEFPSKDRNAVPTVDAHYQSSVPGLYVLGALIGYPLIKQAMNQGYEVVEHILGNDVEPADQVLVNEKLDHLPGDVNQNLEMIRGSLPLFKDLTDPQFRELIIDSTVHLVKPGQVIFERNDYTDTFFSIVSGQVEVDLPNGESVAILAGDYFGEMGLLSGRRRSATIRAAKEGAQEIMLLESPRKQILKLISSVDSVKQQIDNKFLRNALQTKIFPDVEPRFIDNLVSRAKMKLFKKGDVFFKEGDAGDVLYVIRKGSVKISRLNSKGVDVAQTYIPAGNYVGEMALLSEETMPRSATVTAAVACETIMIEKIDFLDLLRTNPSTKKRITQLAKERKIENITTELDQESGGILDFMVGQGVTDAENVLLIDSDLCVGCDNCEAACAATHQGYSRLDRKGGRSFASIQIPISCRHCENPLCMLDCPPDALTRQPDGEVVIRDSCIGCGNCVNNCPYGVIKLVYPKPKGGLFSLFNFGSSAGADKGAAKAGKCDLCSDLSGGPACVRACPTGAAMRVNPSKLVELVNRKQGV